eukprot:602378-Lingulodinium_polyedra.AAC.1
MRTAGQTPGPLARRARRGRRRGENPKTPAPPRATPAAGDRFRRLPPLPARRSNVSRRFPPFWVAPVSAAFRR